MPNATRPAILLLLVLGIAACTPAQVRLPHSLAQQGESHAVTGISPRRAGDPILFGPYSVRELDDGGLRSSGASVGRAEFWQHWHPWRFELSTPGQPILQVHCEASRDAIAWGDGDHELEIEFDGRGGPALGCGFHRDTDRAPYTLELASERGELQGHFGTPGGRYTVRSLHMLEGARFPTSEPVAFAFSRGDDVVMVVEVVNQGRVVFSPGTDARDRLWLAGAATALLSAGSLDPR